MSRSPGEPPNSAQDIARALQQAVDLHRAGRFARARRIYDRLLEARPNHPDVLHMRGMMELERGGPELAVPWIEKAADISPSNPAIQINLGLAYELTARLEDARYAYERASQLAPNLARPKVGLAGVWTHLKRDDEAERILRGVLERHPGEAQACVISCEIFTRRGEFERAERALHAALSRPDLEGRARGAVLMALGKLLDKLERYPEAFDAFARGNALRAVAYDPAVHERAVDRYASVWTRDLVERLAAAGSASTQPVFIIGMPRSGTSLTEQIIAMHEGVFAGGERMHMREIQTELPALLGVSGTYPECLGDEACVGAWARAADAAEAAYREMAPDALRITDKLPSNAFRVGLLAAVFPHAKLIHCIRDPRDTALSCFMQDFFAHGVPFASSLDHIGRYYRAYRRIMDHWRAILPGRLFESSYEDLVASPERSTKDLMEHVGLEWSERCLRFHESERFIPTASAQQVRRPMYASAVDRWKRYEKHLAPYLHHFDG